MKKSNSFSSHFSNFFLLYNKYERKQGFIIFEKMIKTQKSEPLGVDPLFRRKQKECIKILNRQGAFYLES